MNDQWLDDFAQLKKNQMNDILPTLKSLAFYGGVYMPHKAQSKIVKAVFLMLEANRSLCQWRVRKKSCAVGKRYLIREVE